MYKTFNMGNNITCIINSNYTIAATIYTLEKWFVSGTLQISCIKVIIIIVIIKIIIIITDVASCPV